jgi:transcriptional regulator with XRE-family HTH domain
MPQEKRFFAVRLRELRDGAGLSQNGLAARSGVPVATIRQFEYGRREPTYGTLVKLAHGLGLSLAAFDQEPPAGAAKVPQGRKAAGPPGQKAKRSRAGKGE